jgi:hypothetical protein
MVIRQIPLAYLRANSHRSIVAMIGVINTAALAELATSTASLAGRLAVFHCLVIPPTVAVTDAAEDWPKPAPSAVFFINYRHVLIGYIQLLGIQAYDAIISHDVASIGLFFEPLSLTHVATN